MAFLVHIARVGVFNIDNLGNLVRKDDPTVTLRQQLQTHMDHRVIPDATIANSTNYPSIQDYIEAEAASNYVVQHIDQTTIITYLRTSGGGFA